MLNFKSRVCHACVCNGINVIHWLVMSTEGSRLPDGGFGWVVVFAAFLLNFVVVCIICIRMSSWAIMDQVHLAVMIYFFCESLLIASIITIWVYHLFRKQIKFRLAAFEAIQDKTSFKFDRNEQLSLQLRFQVCH